MNKIVSEDVTAELERLRRENEILSGQVKRLVRVESKIYDYQEKLDAQLKEYSGLYDLNFKLSSCRNLAAIFGLATAYIINRLDYERVIFFQKREGEDAYSVCACGGYHSPEEESAVRSLSISSHAPFLTPLFEGAKYRICTQSSLEQDLTGQRDGLQMNEYLVYPLGNRSSDPAAILVMGNSAENAEFYRRISDSEEALFGVGNLVGLLSSSIENQILYAGLKKALEQERLAEAKYRGIFENAMEGIFQTTLQGRFISCNPATAAILGYETPEEVLDGIVHIGRQLYVDPERRDELYGRMARRENVKNFEVEFYRKDGSKIWVNLSTRPAFDEKGELVHINGILQDITERKRDQEALGKLSKAVEQSPVSIMITDTEGRIEFVNPKFVQLTGYSPKEVLGKRPNILNSGSTPDTSRKLWETISRGKVWEGEFLNKKKNGELFSEHATIAPIRNKDGVITHYLAIKEDISERKLLEAQLFQSQKMESIGRLAGGVAHDFNNMLSVILGSAQLAMRDVEKETPVWQDLDQIIQAARRSREITRQLLAFSRKEIMAPREVNLNEHFVEMQKTLGHLIGEDISMTFKPAEGLWTVNADTTQLDQILVNLAVNARDAMGNGGLLIIETANVRVDRSYSHFHLDASPGEYVQLSVSDNGCGMDAETVAHVFEPFFTTKEVGRGTGLGLATVYGIVRQHSGFINVYSEPGQGTTFQVNFPRCAGAAVEETEVEEESFTGSGTVLLVEDDPLVRRMTLKTLEEIGYDVIEASGADEAIAFCRDENRRIDAILTDVVMPGMNGKAMVDAIEEFRPGFPVLFMSGYTKDLVAQRGVVAEGRHFIQKPFDIQSLSKKLKETLQQK